MKSWLMFGCVLLLSCGGGEPVQDSSTEMVSQVPKAHHTPVISWDDDSTLIGSHFSHYVDRGQDLLVHSYLDLAAGERRGMEFHFWPLSGKSATATVLEPIQGWASLNLRDGGRIHVQSRVSIPKELEKTAYWLMVSLVKEENGAPIKAEDFVQGRVPLGVIHIGGDDKDIAISEEIQDPSTQWPKLAVGGDVNLGRRQNAVTAQRGTEDALGDLDLIADADLVFVNLESVVSHSGRRNLNKGEQAPFYYRGRPEQLGILETVGVDVVSTANNHGMDYGFSALTEQADYLDGMGIAHTGTGRDFDEACRTVYSVAGNLVVAFMAIDSTMQAIASSQDRPGTCYLDPSQPELWTSHLTDRIAEARDHAHLVFVGVHWGNNRQSRPTHRTQALGHRIIDSGADGVLGSSAHILQGVEVYKDRPILYDSGNLLFDTVDKRGQDRSGVFVLDLSPEGVRSIEMRPIDIHLGYTRMSEGNTRGRMLYRFLAHSQELNTYFQLDREKAVFHMGDVPLRSPPIDPVREFPAKGGAPKPATEIPMDCMTAGVPKRWALKEPVVYGPLVLLGVQVGKSLIKERQHVSLETYWMVNEKVRKDYVMRARLNRRGKGEIKVWHGDHDFCDWLWPTSRWEVGEVYRDLYYIRPPTKLPDGTYDLSIGVENPKGKSLVGDLVEFQGVVVR